MGMCMIAAVELAWFVHWAIVILKVAIGLGFVIFVHELGHFLVAKACGVKCDKFFVGFDIGGYKISHKWGETEYGIGILPLGGYVKMLGQDDDPSHIAEQMQKSQVDADSADGVEIVGPRGERYVVDRRSYLAKSVPQRMAIISAGVVMNMIFALIFAVIAYGMGVPYIPSIVSETVPGSPAWMAGIEPGDEIVKLGDRVNPSFMQLRGGVTLGDRDKGIPIVIRRASDGKEIALRLKPEQNEGRGLATIGIRPPFTVKLVDAMPTVEGSPAARATLVGPASDNPVANQATDAPPSFHGNDEIVRVNDVAVSNYRGLAEQLAHHPDELLRVTVRRTQGVNEDSSDESTLTKQPEAAEELTFDVKPQHMRRFGMVMEMGPIDAIQPDSPAEKAGLKVGDIILAVDGQSISNPKTLDDWDPVTFSDRMRLAAVAGRSVALKVSRPKENQDSSKNFEEVELTVTPRVPEFYQSILPPRTPMGVPALGIAFRIENRVAAVIAGTPAASADLKPGDTLAAAKVILPESSESDAVLEESHPFGPTDPNWPMFFSLLQWLPTSATVEFTITRGDADQKVNLSPVDVSDLFVAQRGFYLQDIERIRTAASFAEQVRYGWDETVDALTMVYRFLQKIGSEVPITTLGGPITIAGAAASSASKGLSTLLIFLTILSANLAVINFLPIPLLDGGHMVFLAYEGIRGRPASEKFVVALHTVGFVFIVSLMLFVIALDVGLIDRGL